MDIRTNIEYPQKNPLSLKAYTYWRSLQRIMNWF